MLGWSFFCKRDTHYVYFPLLIHYCSYFIILIHVHCPEIFLHTSVTSSATLFIFVCLRDQLTPFCYSQMCVIMYACIYLLVCACVCVYVLMLVCMS